jgi:hypothetical protein
MTDPSLYIPTMWDDIGILLYDPYFWVLSVTVVITVATVTRLYRNHMMGKAGRWY